MCTYIIHSDPGSDIPLMLAMTRDENPRRATESPFVWKDQTLLEKPVAEGKMHLHFLAEFGPERYLDAQITAPRDNALGGTFMAQNKYGVVAAINNRRRVTKTADSSHMMSRGGLPLDAMCFETAKEAAEKLWPVIKEHQRTAKHKYNGLNLLIADANDVYVITNAISGDITVDNETRLEHEKINGFELALWKLPKGTSMLASLDPNDLARSKRTETHLPIFSGDKIKKPKPGDFVSWHAVLKQMVYRDEFSADPFSLSICQPDPAHPKTDGKGYLDWVTVGANFLMLSKKADGDGLKLDWFAVHGQLLPGEITVKTIQREGAQKPWTKMILSDEGLEPPSPPFRSSLIRKPPGPRL